MRQRTNHVAIIAPVILWFAGSPCCLADRRADSIIESTGIRGGLVVHLGCGDSKLTAALHADDRYLVHGLGTNAAQVAEARETIRAQGLYGLVSVDRFDGRRLPYVDNLVNLLVADDLKGVTMREVMRVLAPRGVAWVSGETIVKPWPNEIDEWTHFLHGADNNAVAKDTVVGPPKRYQWISGPRWARSHDHLSSLSAMVSAAGRIFCIIDEAPPASIAFTPQWRLIARDAFSGVVLWKRAIEPWEGHLRPFRTGPTALARRLVAAGDRVYVTLGYGKPITILDAATGKVIRECEQTTNALEIAVDDGTLFAVVGDHEPFPPQDTGRMSHELQGTGQTSGAPERHWRVWREKAPLKRLVAVDAETGAMRWKKDDADTREIMPTAMAVSGGRVFLQNERALVALDAGSGRELWRAARPVSLDAPGSSAPTLVASGDVVICADRKLDTTPRERDERGRSASWHLFPHTAHSTAGEAIAYDAATGERLWSVTAVENFRAPADVFVRNDLAFIRSNEPGLDVGLDLRTGLVQHLPKGRSPIRDPGTHWRCYRNKATDKYLVLCEQRTEFYDLDSGAKTRHFWVRGACQYGVLPCNGLLYAPHHPCTCAIESKLDSFNALAPNANPMEDTSDSERLERGPAYIEADSLPSARISPASEDWPTYRCDAARSGVATTAVGAEPVPAWEAGLKGRLTAPVVADGILLTAAPDSHTVYALGADTGKTMWSYMAGGAVDSPPTLYDGTAIFGCADGWIYCLRASDGHLAWRYRAAQIDRRIVAYGKVESVWPLHGSVLIQDGIVYAVAGRESHMDGLFFHALHASTGRPLVRRRITQASFPDVLSCQGGSIFMRQMRLDRQGEGQPGNVPHLFSATGFLDDTWWHRTYWQFGYGMSGGYTRWFAAGEVRPSGRLMVMDKERIYGFGRLNQFDYVGSHVGLGSTQYLLYAANRSDFDDAGGNEKRGSLPWTAKKPDIPTLWQAKIDLLARGMVLCDQVLFLTGPPDYFGAARGDVSHPYTPILAESLRLQREAMDGKKGSFLWAVSAVDGRRLWEQKLKGLPA
ncbi:MAG: outer membrane protein assembly factor BamB family protein, partial [Planctomycetota bacterium]